MTQVLTEHPIREELRNRSVTDAVRSLRRLRDAETWRAQVRSCYTQNPQAIDVASNRFYYQRLVERLRHVIHPGARVLDVGCGNGAMLAALQPGVGVGIDLVPGHIQSARKRYPELRFEVMSAEDVADIGETFDYIVVSQVLTESYDVLALLRGLRRLCHDRTRLVVVNYSRLWQPAIRAMEWLGVKRVAPPQNWLPVDELRNLLELSDWETVRQLGATLAPLAIPVVSNLINRYAAPLPLMRSLCLNHILVVRPATQRHADPQPVRSVSVVVPARNESGHIRQLIARLPNLAPRQELIFVEGGSADDTWDVIQDAVAQYRGNWTLKAIQQPGEGKADAVRAAFDICTGDVLMILDADLSVPPEELVTFRDALAGGQAEFVNGSRMVYPKDKKAMRFLNLLGNKFFGAVFTYLLSQRFRDTLCGTKVLRRTDYERIKAGRSYFGDFDPFGDFDLLFGAARQNLKIVDVPVHYKARQYGDTNISRFRHGLILLRMCLFAARKIKFV